MSLISEGSHSPSSTSSGDRSPSPGLGLILNLDLLKIIRRNMLLPISLMLLARSRNMVASLLLFQRTIRFMALKWLWMPTINLHPLIRYPLVIPLKDIYPISTLPEHLHSTSLSHAETT